MGCLVGNEREILFPVSTRQIRGKREAGAAALWLHAHKCVFVLNFLLNECVAHEKVSLMTN